MKITPRVYLLILLLHLGVALSWAAGAESTLNFLVVGDWGRDGNFGQKEVGAEMGSVAARIDAKFVISVGDNFYDDGVASIETPQWKTSFEDIYDAPSLQVPWYVVLGNHDYRGNALAQIDYTMHSARWKMPSRYFRVVRRIDAETTVEFFFLDTNPYIGSYRKDPEKYKGILDEDPARQTAWLQEALAASTAQWKIVCGHHPIISGSPRHGDTPELVAAILPLLKKYDVPVYLNGHDHDLQHLSKDGLQFFCSGAGSKTREAARNEHTMFTLGLTPGFLQVELSRENATFTFIDSVGVSHYTTKITRTPRAAQPAAALP